MMISGSVKHNSADIRKCLLIVLSPLHAKLYTLWYSCNREQSICSLFSLLTFWQSLDFLWSFFSLCSVIKIQNTILEIASKTHKVSYIKFTSQIKPIYACKQIFSAIFEYRWGILHNNIDIRRYYRSKETFTIQILWTLISIEEGYGNGIYLPHNSFQRWEYFRFLLSKRHSLLSMMSRNNRLCNLILYTCIQIDNKSHIFKWIWNEFYHTQYQSQGSPMSMVFSQ